MTSSYAKIIIMQAIILKKIPIKEYDELVICYTPDFGKATYVAKSVLRPTSKQASHLDILTLVDFELVQKNHLPIITNAYSLNNFGYLKSSLPAVAVANYVLEVFNKFVFENDPDLKLWQFLNNRLTGLDELATKSMIDWKTELADTQKEIMEVLGYNETINMEDIVQSHLSSLDFAREIFAPANPSFSLSPRLHSDNSFELKSVS